MNDEQLAKAIKQTNNEQIPQPANLWSNIESRVLAQSESDLHIVASTPRNRSTKRWAIGLVASLLVLIGLLAFTPLSSLAQELLDSLFNRADTNEYAVTPTYDDDPQVIIMSSPDNDISDPDYWIEQMAKAETLAGFDVKEVAQAPSGYHVDSIGFFPDRHTVSQHFTIPGGEIVITQQPVEFVEAGLLTDWKIGIGADAPIQKVPFGDLTAEYVAGAWIVPPDAPDQAIWNESVPMFRFRWQEDDMLYEIWAMGRPGERQFDPEEMIEIAESLQ